ncbi:hypothetical protein AYO45_00940 [Gammaproteobacteria bacterium SCGC AG-212-F23]|nr:hypothetical protein AYO45_00940 [Gammaproteobacteria bacterium SCGC AG-212-F23]
MDKLAENITNTFGAKGEQWIADLPDIIDKLTTHWQLTHLNPVNNMSFHFVAKATLNNNQAAVLKIGCDEKSVKDEMLALQYFNGTASVKLIDYHEKYYALLLHQAIPGITLKSFYPEKLEYVIECYVNTMQKLHEKHLPSRHPFRHISDWLKSIDKVTSKLIPAHLLEKAIATKNKLLATSSKQVLLHGDLHHDNLLQDGNTWVTIDPKGIVGEPEFEIAAFDFMYINELANNPDTKQIFAKRIKMLAHQANLDASRIKAWVFVRLILMAAWCIEDNHDPKWVIKLAEAII